MSREARCGRLEAETRLRVATAYLDTAELAATENTPEARNVAAGNAVLAVKDPAHYGDKFVSPTSLAKALRGTRLLLESARDIVSGA